MKLLRAFFTVSGITLLSRVLGFMRDVCIAQYFGINTTTDAFWTAFRIPNLLRRTFAEGAFSQAFVPLLSEYRQQRSASETRDFMDHVAGTLALSLFLVSIAGILAAPLIVFLTATGFVDHTDQFNLTVTLMRWLFPYLLLISLASLAGAILNAHHHFWLPALTPTLLNLAMIGATVWLAPHVSSPVLALVVGVWLGGILQLGVQLPLLSHLGLLPRPRFSWANAAVKRLITQMIPAIFAVSAGQISLLFNGWFASFLAAGSISWLYYADRLMEFPTGLLGSAVGTILLPSLSHHIANTAYESYERLLDWGLRLTILLALPAALGLALLAAPILTALFLGGKYTSVDVQMTASALQMYAFGLLGLILVKILAPAFYARQQMKIPVRIALIALASTQLLNLIFIRWLQHAGLALAISIGATINAALLYRNLRKKGYYNPQPGWNAFLSRIAAATASMGLTVVLLTAYLPAMESLSREARMIQLVVLIGAAASVYGIMLYALGIRRSALRLPPEP